MGLQGDEGGKSSSFPHMVQTRTTTQPMDQTVTWDDLCLPVPGSKALLPQGDPPLTEQS